MAIDAAADLTAEDGVPQRPVAVVIAVCNGEAYVAEAVRSALAEKEVGKVVVVDDGSTDRTRDVVASIRDQRLTLTSNPGVGVSAARNHGATLSDTRWLLFLDADDRLVPGGVTALLASGATDPVMIYGDYERIAANGRRIGKRFLMRRRAKPSGDILRALLAGNFIINGGIALVRRDIFAGIGGFDPTLSLCEDWHLWCRIAAMGAVVYVPRRVMDYRVHTTSVMMGKHRRYEDFKPALDAIFAHPLVMAAIAAGERERLRLKSASSLKAYCAAQIYRKGARREGIVLAMRAIGEKPRETPRVLLRLGAAMAGF